MIVFLAFAVPIDLLYNMVERSNIYITTFSTVLAFKHLMTSACSSAALVFAGSYHANRVGAYPNPTLFCGFHCMAEPP